MERKENKIMNALETFRAGLAAVTDSRKALVIYQAFDRLYLDYQDGRIQADEVLSRLNALQTEMTASSEPVALTVNAKSDLRSQVLLRNHQALAERLLEMPRGSWDRRHVDAVQQAISVLSSEKADELSLSLQKRLSDSVWASNFELVDSVSSINEERQNFESILESLVSHDVETGYNNVDDSQREVARNIRTEAIRAAASRAQANHLSDLLSNASQKARSVEASDALVAKLEAESQNRQDKLRANYEDASTREAVERAVQSVQHAAKDILDGETSKVRMIQAGIAKEIAASNDDALKLKAQTAFAAFESSDVLQNVDALKQLARALDTANASNYIAQLEGIESTSKLAQTLESFSIADAPQAPASDDDAALLQARMMYEQHRMKYEQSAVYADQAADMLKALDANAQVPDYTVRRASHPSVRNVASVSPRMNLASEAIKVVRALAQSASSADVGLYAPYAGAESILSVRSALHIADQAAPIATDIPTLQNARVRRSNQAMRDIRQLAFMPSVRSEMGFTAARYKLIENTADRPLFKRVNFDPKKTDTADMLPALYKVAGLKLKQADTPLRKSYGLSDLNSANLELIKIIENQFDPSMKTRVDKAPEGEQKLGHFNGEVARAANSLAHWVERRRNPNEDGADTKSRIKSARVSPGEIASNLRAEGKALPKNIQQKLSPYIGFDLSNVKIYSGPVAEMASAAMGAQAFTLGKSIFFGASKLDFNSAEGLGLLAHELLHTTHFNSGDSVNLKEQAAEAMEARVKAAFGSSEKGFALEKKTSAAAPKVDASAKAADPNTAKATKHISAEELYDQVSEMVLGMLMDDLDMEKKRGGNG